MTKNILIVFGTRPEIIKLAPLILLLKNSELRNNIIVASTSQHENLLDEQLNYWKIIPDYILTSSSHKGNLTRLLSHTLTGLQDIIEQVKTIEYIIVQGDTNTALACSNLAFLNKLKLIYIESGLRSFDLLNPFPEELNRIIASRVAYFHFAPTETSKLNLLNEGIDSSKIMVIGNTVIDALLLAKNKGEIAITGTSTTVLITLHRRENIEKNYLVLVNIIRELANQYIYLNFIWVTHPNCANDIKTAINGSTNILVHEHMPYEEFVNHYDGTKMVITDSGGVSEEAIHLGIPIIIFRKTTERIEAIVEKYPMIVSLEKNSIIYFFKEHINKINKTKYSYGNGKSSQKIVDWLITEIGVIEFDTLIIGGGPAGTGLLLKALKDGNEGKIFNKRIGLVEKSEHLIRGNITQYNVNSDTFSDVFLECLDGATGEVIPKQHLQKEIAYIREYKGYSIPLKKLSTYFDKLGLLLKRELEDRNKCRFYMESSVEKITETDTGAYEISIVNKKKPLIAKQIILATGGVPKNITGDNLTFANVISLNAFRQKCEHSDRILRSGIPDNLKMGCLERPKIVILGGSHSAFSVAHLLLNSAVIYNFKQADIKIWSKSVPKLYFNSKEEAEQNGYDDFTEKDFCQITKKLYRLAGLRMDGRELYMRMLGLGNKEKEKRVCLKIFSRETNDIQNDLEEASLIILAFGYNLNIPPFLNKAGSQIKFKGEFSSHWVNENCELLDENEKIVSNVFATGLATGFIPSGDLGGEPSFNGQTNGIWYYQNAIADRIINRL